MESKFDFDMNNLAPKKIQAGVKLSTVKGGIMGAYIGGAVMNFIVYAFVTFAQISFGIAGGLEQAGDLLLQSIIYFTCAYVMFLLTVQIGAERAKQTQSFIQAKERYEAARDGLIKNHGTEINEFCEWYVHGELKAARTNSLTEISMSYEEYEREYLGLGKKALEKTDLSKHERKVVWRTNKILPVKLESWMITRSRKVSFHRIAVDSSAQEKKSTDSKLHFASSLITTLAASFAVVDVASAFSMQVLILALVRLIPFIINIPLGLIRGYGLYATREVSNFESLCTLIDSANVYFEGKEEKVFMSDETDR